MKRRSKNVCRSLEHGLHLYALAASAAGVSLLALAQPADAKIVYTPVHMKLGRNVGFLLDLNHDGINDFWIFNNFSNFGNRNSYRLFAYPYGNAIAGTKDASALPAGAEIGAKQHFSFRATNMAHFYTYSGRIQTSSGLWKNVKNRYLGLRFSINGKVHYGWARLSVTVHKHGVYGISAVITGYAYETIANKAIIAGKTKGPDVITPEPASLGHLARGASAISAWRRTDSVASIH